MTLVVTRDLDNSVSTYNLLYDRVWMDRHLFTPTERDRPVQATLKVRDQVNGLRVVDEKGRFARATPEERVTLLEIFEEAQTLPTRKEEGMYRSAMDSIEDCHLYEQLSNTVFTNGNEEPRPVFVQTDVPRRLADSEVECWSIPTYSMDEYVQKRNAYQLREFSVGENRYGADWNEWHEDATLNQEDMLKDLGFKQEDINAVRQLVQEALPVSQTHFSCVFDAWDVLMTEDRTDWAEREVQGSWEEKVMPHQEAADKYFDNWCTNEKLKARVPQFIKRYVEHTYDQASDLDTENGAWFDFMCSGIERMQQRIQKELGAATFCQDKAAWVGFMQWTQNMYWHYYRELTIANKARFEVTPDDDQRQAISYMLWLERLLWETEMEADAAHIDNWTQNFELQRVDCQRVEFNSMWELNQAMR